MQWKWNRSRIEEQQKRFEIKTFTLQPIKRRRIQQTNLSHRIMDNISSYIMINFYRLDAVPRQEWWTLAGVKFNLDAPRHLG